MPIAKKLFEFFNHNHLYKEIISLIDTNDTDIIRIVLKFIQQFLCLGEQFQEINVIEENICTIRINVKEFCLLKIDSLILHPEDKISQMSIEIHDQYFNDIN